MKKDEIKFDETILQNLKALPPKRRAKLLEVVAMKLAKRYVPGDDDDKSGPSQT